MPVTASGLQDCVLIGDPRLGRIKQGPREAFSTSHPEAQHLITGLGTMSTANAAVVHRGLHQHRALGAKTGRPRPRRAAWSSRCRRASASVRATSTCVAWRGRGPVAAWTRRSVDPSGDGVMGDCWRCSLSLMSGIKKPCSLSPVKWQERQNEKNRERSFLDYDDYNLQGCLDLCGVCSCERSLFFEMGSASQRLPQSSSTDSDTQNGC